ncbi:TonB-dependent receptor [Vibrio harveyi]|nr:TonB-dependent receptor [Vibrio harveyi]
MGCIYKSGLRRRYQDAEDEYIRTITPWEGSAEVRYTNQDFNAYALLSWAYAMDRVPTCQSDIGLAVDCAQTSSWSTVDLGATYHVTKDLRLSATVVNLFDKEYIRYQDVAGIADENKHYSTEPGTLLHVQCEIRILGRNHEAKTISAFTCCCL